MTTTLKSTVLAATIIAAFFFAGPVVAGEWFGVQVSNHGLSLGFGSSNWGIWGSSWSSGGWSSGFIATLAGYGEWVHVDGLGRVWRPWVAAGWRPFTHGRWVWTSMGWTWVSYEPWGWAPHHYGNWAFTTFGWVWSPGYVYHPGNVVWVGSGAYVGWYPCAPRGWSHAHRAYRRGWNHGYANGHHDGYGRGYADGWRDARYATWVPWSRVGADNAAHHAVDHREATRAVPRSNVTALAKPPSRGEVERRGGRAVPEARVVERKATIDGREVRVVRPEGQARTVERHAEATVRHALAPAARERVTAARNDREGSKAKAPVTRPSRSNTPVVRRDQSADRPEPGSTTRSSPPRRGASSAPSRTKLAEPTARRRGTPVRTTTTRTTSTTVKVKSDTPRARPTRASSTTERERARSERPESKRSSEKAQRRSRRTKN
jgi:hypothetical protein